ncbi:MAG TPA: DDE-type integrase/transposase/recombinase [Thermoleophilaceae bacterium]|nr:DDE-type integrase/transposase/recombinase [Thermoleophilaceae bacterium]
MSHDDVLLGYRLRLFTLAEEIGVRPACRAMGVHHSTYYRWKQRVDRWGLEALNVRERRRPRMPNQIGPHLEQRVIAFALGHPGLGPRRISAELRREKWGGIRISEHGVWRVLCRVGLNTRNKRLALIARHRDPYERKPPVPPPERHIDASEPGEKVQLDCFYVGRLSGTKGTVWQYSAIDVASAYAWAELRTSERNPRARHTRELVHRVARELKQAGWKLRQVGTDNGSEFRSKEFRDEVDRLGARQRFIKAGNPNSNGCVERLQLTILEECWRPSFARSLVPKMTALQRDLDEYLTDYNHDRAHTGRLTQGRVPADIVFGAHKTRTVR